MSYEISVDCSYLSREINAEISSYLMDLCGGLKNVFAKYPPDVVMDALYTAYHPYDYEYLPSEILETFAGIEADFGIEQVGLFNKAVTIHLLANYERIVQSQKIPDEYIMGLTRVLTLLWESLRKASPEEYVYPNDFYFKDIRILTGRSLIYNASVVDHGIYLPNTIYRNNGWYDNFRCIWYLATVTRGMGPFFRIHVDSRLINHQSDEDRQKRRIKTRFLRAELMRLNPKVKGFVGSGWLEDPNLHLISPRYTKSFQLGQEQNVFRVYDGTSEWITSQAISTSRTRREAYERGEYQPAAYTKITPRQSIIGWAEKNKHLLET